MLRCFQLLFMVQLLLSSWTETSAQDDYKHGPDSIRQDGVPEGMVSKHRWESSGIFPGTVRDYWIYLPAQYKPENPAAVMVFQDGGSYVNVDRSFRIPIVFDNLIHKGDMPVTIGIFLNPGVLPASAEGAADSKELPATFQSQL